MFSKALVLGPCTKDMRAQKTVRAKPGTQYEALNARRIPWHMPVSTPLATRCLYQSKIQTLPQKEA